MDFKGLFATLPWTWLPFGLRHIVQTGWMLYRNRLVANPGLSYFVSTGKPTEDAANVLFNVLGHVDLFAVWHLVLIYVVLRVVPRFGKAKALVLVSLYAALNLGLRLLPTLLGRSLMLGMAG